MPLESCPWPISRVFDRDVEWHRSVASKTLGIILPGIMAALKVRTCIEIGVANGFTTQVLSATLSALGNDGLLLSADYNAQCAQIARDAANAFPNVKFEALQTYSATIDWAVALKRYQREQADLALIDGDHEFEPALKDCELCHKVLAPNGLLVLHDYHPEHPGVPRAAQIIMEKYGYSRFFIPEWAGGAYGAAILQKPQEGVWKVKG